MAQVLEMLCYRFARDHNINLWPKEGGILEGERDGLSISLMQIGAAYLFGVNKAGESSVVLAYDLPNKDDTLTEIEIERACLRDYLTLLSRSKSSFAQIARERFEFYLNTTDISRCKEGFSDTNALDVFWILKAFYPPLIKK